MQKKIHRIVVRRDDYLGDMVIALPVLKALRANYPQAEFTLMVKESQRTLCETVADAFIDPVPLERFSHYAKKYDLAFNIDYFGPGNREKQSLRYGVVNHINAVPGKRRSPMVRHLMDGLAGFGLAVPHIAEPRFPIPSHIKLQVSKWLRESGVNKKNSLWIGIHVGSRVREKCWQAEKFARLALWLYRSFGARLFFLGAKNEEKAIRSIESKLPEGVARTIIGEPLDFVAGVLARMDFLIGNDSGIGHLASAVKTPTLSIFGPSSPVHWRPAGKKSIVVYKEDNGKGLSLSRTGPLLSVEEVKQGVLLCIQRHITREDFTELDYLRVSEAVHINRSSSGIVVQSSKRGPACLVSDGWRRVKQILDAVRKNHSYRETLRKFPDAGPLLDLFILHRIIHQGSAKKRIAQ